MSSRRLDRLHRHVAAAAVVVGPLLLAAACANPPEPSAPPFRRTVVGGVGGWDYLAVDPQRHRLFITRGDRVQVVDTTALTLAHEIPGTEGVHGVALAPDKHVGLTSNGGSSSVT
ncbi:MAG: YncE family protein, partial [Pseudomonadota bacterium]|nr:YncE family protein [Pseudomonadota bacterium]